MENTLYIQSLKYFRRTHERNSVVGFMIKYYPIKD